MFFFKRKGKARKTAGSQDRTRLLEATQREEMPKKMPRRRRRRTARARGGSHSVSGSQEATTTRRRSGQTVEEDTSIQTKTSTAWSTHQHRSAEDTSAHHASKESSVHRASRAAKKAQVKVFVEETFRKGVKGLIIEFKSMKRMNDFTKMQEFLAQNPQGRNRYKDVGCLDKDRVVLHIGPVSYIHANYVSSPTNPKRFICTQAPLPKTCPEFWYMVVQEKSVAILMLCNFIEQNAKKCAEYFPVEEDKPLNFEGVIVELKKQEPFPFPFKTHVHILVRTLEVSAPGQPVHTCLHYHWQDWPDRGVPEADLAPIVLLAKLKENTAPIIVHCSAGIGRTGSIVLIQHSLELLHLPAPLLEISNYLAELRKQRNNSIQTEQQYLYIHQVLLLYLKNTNYLDASVTPYLEAFTRDYVSATKGF